MDITNSWILGVVFYYFINVFAKNYVVINCLIELIRFIFYNLTTYIRANFKFLTNSTFRDQGISHPLVHGRGGPPRDPKNHFAIVICD